MLQPRECRSYLVLFWSVRTLTEAALSIYLSIYLPGFDGLAAYAAMPIPIRSYRAAMRDARESCYSVTSIFLL